MTPNSIDMALFVAIIRPSPTEKAATMVDFATEVVADVREVTERFKVTHDTVYRWFRRGLEHAKVGGKVVTTWQAINRFSRQSSGDTVAASPVFIDRETAAAIRNLKASLGINEGSEARKDGRTKKTPG